MGLRKRFRRVRRQVGDWFAEADRRRRGTRDVALISYPKSGRTWVRFMLDSVGVKLLYDHAGAENRSRFTLEEIADRPARWSEWRVIFMARDPRDTVVSSYFEATKRLKDEYRFHGSIGEFMRSPRYGVEKIARYNLLWLESGTAFRDFLPMSYERLHEATHSEVRRLLSFALRKLVPSERVSRAVEAGRFENMRKVEEKLGGKMNERNRLGGGKPGDPESMKTRRGKVGGWRDYFDDAEAAYMEEVLAGLNYWPRVEAALGQGMAKPGVNASRR